jgi:hypothetical protein
MINDEPLWVLSCPLCEIFRDRKITTKLYWPETIEEIPQAEFIIIDSPVDKCPIIIFRDHTDTILSENWGNMLYRCRKLFGDSVRLKWTTKIAKDHFYCDIKI